MEMQLLTREKKTKKQILGLLTVLTTLGASAVHFYVKLTSPLALNEAVVFPTKPFRLLSPLTIRTIANQSLLMLVLPTVIAGFADLSAVTFCVTRIVPFEGAIAFAVGLLFVYVVASALSTLTVWLSLREVRKARKAGKGDEESWGRKTLKEKIAVVGQESVHEKMARLDLVELPREETAA